MEYTNLWIGDTILHGPWTINAGFRFDLQEGTIGGASTIGTIPLFQDILPPVSAGSRDAGFDWSTVTPRIGASYALGEGRDEHRHDAGERARSGDLHGKCLMTRPGSRAGLTAHLLRNPG